MSAELDRFVEDLRENAERAYAEMLQQRDEIIKAFLAETGLKPSECTQILQTTKDGEFKFWVEKRDFKPVDTSIQTVFMIGTCDNFGHPISVQPQYGFFLSEAVAACIAEEKGLEVVKVEKRWTGESE